jgi:hypothetical protein
MEKMGVERAVYLSSRSASNNITYSKNHCFFADKYKIGNTIMSDTTAGQANLSSLEEAAAKAKAAAKAASADANVYATAYKDIDKVLSGYGIATGKFGGTGSPGEVREVQLKAIERIALTNPALAQDLRAKVEERAKNALVYQEKNAIAQRAYKDSDDLEEQLDNQRGTSSAGARSPSPASDKPGDPTNYNPPPEQVTPRTTTDTETTPTVTLAQAKEARDKLYAEKGEPVQQYTDPNDPNVTIFLFNDGSTARRTGGGRSPIVLDAPQPTAQLNDAAQQKADLAKQKREEAAQLGEQESSQKAQADRDLAALQAAENGGDPAAIAAAQAKYDESRQAYRSTLTTANDLKGEAALAERQSSYLNSVKEKQDAANENGGGIVEPAPIDTASSGAEVQVTGLPEEQQQVPVTDATVQEQPPIVPEQQQEIVSPDTAPPPDLDIQGQQQQEIAPGAGTGATQDEANVINQAIAEDGAKVLVGPVTIEKQVPQPGKSPYVVRSTLDIQTGKITIAILDENGKPSSFSMDGNPDNIIKQLEAAIKGFPPPSQYGAVLQGILAAVKESKAELTKTFQDNKAKAASAAPKTPAAVTASIAQKTERSVFEPPKDWRVRISLAPNATYMYKAENPGILGPLKTTGGVLFPYMPSISVSYSAQYDSQDITHSNYKIHTYRGSSVDQVQISGDFTAQDSTEANYILAVIHFFRTATKMFYGKDQNPRAGTPPPLVYLSGHGQYQFDNHPMVIQSFNYSLPVDVDYINAYPSGSNGAVGGVNLLPYKKPVVTSSTPLGRLRAAKLTPGGTAPAPVFTNAKNINEITRVPTKITVSITCLPIVTRNAVSNYFSLAKYATGELLQGSKNSTNGGGFW